MRLSIRYSGMTDTSTILHFGKAGSTPSSDSIAAHFDRDGDAVVVDRLTTEETVLERLESEPVDGLLVESARVLDADPDFLSRVVALAPACSVVVRPDRDPGASNNDVPVASVSESHESDSSSSVDRCSYSETDADSGDERADRSERLLTELAENTDRVLYVLSADWQELYFVNSAYERLWGHPIGALRDDLWDFFEGIHPDDRSRVQEAMAQLSNGETLEVEFRVDERSGFSRWVRARGEPIRDDDGTVVRIAGFVSEITAEKERREELREATLLLESATQAGAIGTWKWDVQTDRLIASEEFAHTFGLDPDDVEEGVSLDQFVSTIHEADRDRVERSIEEAIEKTGEYEEEYRVWDENGDRRWVLARGHVEYDEDGTPVRFPGALTDITRRKVQERERQQTTVFLQDLYDVTTDPDATLEEKVSKVLELGTDRLGLEYGFLSRIDVGSTHDEFAGTQTIVEATGDHPLLQPDKSHPLTESYCRNVLDREAMLAIPDVGDSPIGDDLAARRFELGSYIGSHVTIDGSLYGTLCFAASDPRDDAFSDADRAIVRLVNRWVGYELERHRSRLALERTNERLEAFTSVVSHDLRNPLNVATGHLEQAMTDASDENLREVDRALCRIETMIEDLLTLARQGSEAVDLERLDLAAASRRAWNTVATADASLAVETDRVIRADRTSLQQILENLVRNAVEHGPDDVSVTVGDLENGFSVEDDGPGIDPSDSERVFEHGYTDAQNGTGLGLSIVDQAVAAQDWAIAVTEASDTGGARFEITNVEVVGRG